MDTDPGASSIGPQLDEAVRSFALAWATGPRPRIETMLEEWLGPGREALLLRLMRIEVTLRGRLGERPAESEYRARFPGHEAMVGTIFTPGSVRDDASVGPTLHSECPREQILLWLAFEEGISERGPLLDALLDWSADRSAPLGQALLKHECLDAPRLAELERRLVEYVAQHDGNEERALEALAALGPDQRELLHQIGQLLHAPTSGPLGLNSANLTIGLPNDGLDTASFWSPRPAPPPPPAPAPAPASAPEAPAQQFGRYRVIKLLAQGGFGQVFLGHDDELDRPVAIKVPNSQRIHRPEEVRLYLAEARHLARLDHPGIVPVYDVGRAHDGRCYIVVKVVDGSDLSARIKRGPFAPIEAARLVLAVAEALHYAHLNGLVHRDVKPANILLDQSGRPIVVDFGLALNDEDLDNPPMLVGTVAYMSPEQARGEGHRVDGRSDIFSLGVVLYELLTRRRPFGGASIAAVLDAVANVEPRPPRQIVDSVPRELERICLRALEKRASDRYTTARDFAEDLRAFLLGAEAHLAAGPGAGSGEFESGGNGAGGAMTASSRSAAEMRTIRIVPKGLRSFDEHDADFFLELFSGPRDREGLPESLRFWKNRIEALGPDKSFRVGVLYGPSGCGKSSLIKAGLLPRLAGHVRTVYVESSAEGTEARLDRELGELCGGAAPQRGLAESLAEIRRGRVLRAGEKLLIVLDQFEQWLFARPEEGRAVLVDALRQCDGRRVQALVLVRDDFWLAASRFMRELEVRLVEGENSALVDLFDPSHARVVLHAFGRAYGAVPASSPGQGQGQGAEHRAFINRAVEGLAQDGKIVPVRLALFAEMVKTKPWLPATLKEIGGARGVGTTFLEEMFGAASASPEHRLHQKAARAVLAALLPENDTDIKGRMRSEAELRRISGYAERPNDFADLIHILDTELRLITPSDAERPRGEAANAEPPGAPAARSHERHYQLAHDYLVHSLRDWLSRKRRETRKGRAELMLEERASAWAAKPENRNLPLFVEWARARLLTNPAEWSPPQHRMMSAANHRYSIRLGWVGLLVALAAGVIVTGAAWFDQHRRRSEALSLVSQLLVAQWDRVPEVLKQMDEDDSWWRGPARQIAEGPARSSADHLRARLALAPKSRDAAEGLLADLAASSPQELRIIVSRLAAWHDHFGPQLWERLENAEAPASAARRYACALAQCDGRSPRWAEAAPGVVEALLKEEDPLRLTGWVDLLRPVGPALYGPLAKASLEADTSQERRLAATAALSELRVGEPAQLAELLLNADDRQATILFRGLSGPVREEIETRMRRELNAPAPRALDGPTADRKASAALVLMRLGRWADLWPWLGAGPDLSVRSRIIQHACRAVSPAKLLPLLAERRPPDARQAMLLALAGASRESLKPSELASVLDHCRYLFEHDPDAGVHSAAELLLRRFGPPGEVEKRARALSNHAAIGNWFINGQGQTMIIVPAPTAEDIKDAEESLAAEDAKAAASNNDPNVRRLPSHRFAISAHEITNEQFQRFLPRGDDGKVPEEDRLKPAGFVSWYKAVQYCRWLTQQEGMPEEQQCYPIDIAPGAPLPSPSLDRLGYRLPTQAEWQFACRAGTRTARFFGEGESALLAEHAWFNRSSDDQVHAVGWLIPNAWGLFDLFGNCEEWCDDAPSPNGVSRYLSVASKKLAERPASLRVLHGGGYQAMDRQISTTRQDLTTPDDELSFLGIRIVRTVR